MLHDTEANLYVTDNCYIEICFFYVTIVYVRKQKNAFSK